MSRRPKHRNPRRNVVKPQMEKLEIRWLMSQTVGLSGSSRTRDPILADIDRIGGGLGRTLAAEFTRWESHHPDAAGSENVALETFEAKKLTQGSLGSWGALRLLVQIEAQGDHQFDALYQRLSGRFERWATGHPALAHATGIDPIPIATPVTTIAPGISASDKEDETAGVATVRSIFSPPSSAGTSPGGAHPLYNVPVNSLSFYSLCPFCPQSANGAMPSSNGDGGQDRTMDSDADMITGAYLQDHQLATYQSLGETNGIDMQYSSLQADPQPVISGDLQVETNTGATAFSSAEFSLTIGPDDQGTPISISSVPNGNYLLQLPVVTATGMSTGIESVTVLFIMYLDSGGTVTDTFTSLTMIVNAASSPYGAGWSIGGLQQMTIGTSGQTLMITDGNNAPELFTSSDGTTYTGYASDTSTITYNSTSHTYTRNYQDGSAVTFNSSGQETSSADANGNTTHYAYVASGPAEGALQTITDPASLITTLAYDSYGHLHTVTDPAGRVTTFTIGSTNDNLTDIEDPDDATTEYGYNSSDEINSETDPNGSTATVTYDSFGRMVTETLFDGTSQVKISPAEEVGLLAWGGSESNLLATMSYVGKVTDPDGSMTTILYDSLGGAIKEIDGNGDTTYITRNSNDWPTAITDPMGRTTSYAYNSSGDVTQITQPDGSNEYITYSDSLGVPTEIKDFDGNTTTYVLDSHGNVTEEEQPGGVDQEWTYNSAGQVLTYTDGNSNTTSYAYDSLGRLTTITEPGAGSPTVRFTYDSAGDETSVTDEVSNTTTYSYDQMGRVLTVQNPVQSGAAVESSYSYDADGNLVTFTEPEGDLGTYLAVTTFTYNARNELVSVTDALNKTTTYIYDPDGNVTSAIDPLDNINTYTYDNADNMLTDTDALGTTTYTYDADDELTSVTNPDGNTTDYGYNSLGDEKTVTLPGSNPTTYTYDEDGDLLTVTDPDNDRTTYVYNALNEETSVTNGDGDTTSYTYDGDGNVLTETDQLDHTTSYSYNAMDEEVTQTQPSGGGTTSYTYDAAGDLTSVTDPDDNVTSYTYNAAHEVATETSPTGGVTTYTYDLVGNLTQSVDPDGHKIQYTYNADNEETSETWANAGLGSPLDVITYTYDADGELTEVTDENATYEYTYNAEGEVTSQGDVGSADLPTVTLTYSYDPAGNETSMSDSLGGVVSYTYNAQNELTNETLSGTGISAEAVAFSYDNAGNMTGLTRYSNLAETTVVAATSYVYDAADQITSITDKNSSGTTLVSYAYTYDAAGLVTQEVRDWNSGSSTDTLDYTYTNNDQLTGVTHTNASFSNESFSYDANGNETGTGYTTSTGNEQTASPGYTYTYDAAGNMITMTQTSTGDVWTYTYNYRNLMTGAIEKTSGGTTLEQVTYTYDALDNRIGMDENGTQTWTLYDDDPDPIMDFNSSGSLEMRYLNGPSVDLVDTVLARQTSGGTVSWYLPDRLGTIRDLISNSGSIIDHVDYSAFGTVLDESSPSSGDRMMGFAGMERDMITGLSLAVHRVEMPRTGRWTVLDPKGFEAGDSNLYRYVSNDATNALDPNGEEGVSGAMGGVVGSTIGFGIGAVVVGGAAVLTAPVTLPVAAIVGGTVLVAGTVGWFLPSQGNGNLGHFANGVQVGIPIGCAFSNLLLLIPTPPPPPPPGGWPWPWGGNIRPGPLGPPGPGGGLGPF
jgi:RHS repeat-associated protein